MESTIKIPNHFKLVVLLCSGGLDSTISSYLFLNKPPSITWDKIVMVFTETPLTRKDYAERIFEVVCRKLDVELIVLRGTWKMYRPPLCRYNWKLSPLIVWLRHQPKPILLVTGKKRKDNPVRARYQQWDVFSPNRVKEVYEYKPLWNMSKEDVWKIAENVFPKLVSVWKEIASINNGHTSPDCVPCLRKSQDVLTVDVRSLS